MSILSQSVKGAYVMSATAVLTFISEPVLKGFIVGLALTIVAGQLPKLFGIKGGDGSLPDTPATIRRHCVHIGGPGSWSAVRQRTSDALCRVIQLWHHNILVGCVAEGGDRRTPEPATVSGSRVSLFLRRGRVVRGGRRRG